MAPAGGVRWPRTAFFSGTESVFRRTCGRGGQRQTGNEEKLKISQLAVRPRRQIFEGQRHFSRMRQPSENVVRTVHFELAVARPCSGYSADSVGQWKTEAAGPNVSHGAVVCLFKINHFVLSGVSLASDEALSTMTRSRSERKSPELPFDLTL